MPPTRKSPARPAPDSLNSDQAATVASAAPPAEDLVEAEPGPRSVVEAVVSVVADLAAAGGVAKSEESPELGYRFRGVEALTGALAPLLGRHGVVIIPAYELVDRSQSPAMKEGWTDVLVRAAWTIYGPAGDHLEAVTYGLGRDRGDKGFLKASTAAYKDLALRVFTVGDQTSDPDATSDADGRVDTAPPPADPVVDDLDAQDLADRLNALGKPARATFLATFAAKPAQLPARLLDLARHLVEDLEADTDPIADEAAQTDAGEPPELDQPAAELDAEGDAP